MPGKAIMYQETQRNHSTLQASALNDIYLIMPTLNSDQRKMW